MIRLSIVSLIIGALPLQAGAETSPLTPVEEHRAGRTTASSSNDDINAEQDAEQKQQPDNSTEESIGSDLTKSQAPKTTIDTTNEKSPTLDSDEEPTTSAREPYIEEVIVISTKQEKVEQVVSRTLDVEQIFNIPGLRDDALAAVETFAGVTTLQADFDGPSSQGFYFRGSNQDENHFEIDGLSVDYIYHLGGPFAFSVLNGRLVKRLKFYPSNSSNIYPSVNGGVIDISLKQPILEGFRQEYDLGFLSAGAMIEGGLGSGQDGFWLAARRSYIDFFLDSTNLDEQGDGREGEDGQVGIVRFPEFYDIQGRWYRELSNGFTDLTFILSHDDFLVSIAGDPDPRFNGSLASQRGYIAVGWRTELTLSSESVFFTQLNYLTPNSRFLIGNQGADDPNPGAPNAIYGNADDMEFEVRHNWRHTEKFDLRYGFELTRSQYRFNGFIFFPPDPDTGIPFGKLTGSEGRDATEKGTTFNQEAYFQATYRPISQLGLEFSVRSHNSQREARTPTVSVDSHYDGLFPRFNLLYTPSDSFSFYYRWGDFGQLPAEIDLSINFGNPRSLDLVRSRTNLVGINYIAHGHDLTVDLWHKELKDLVVPVEAGCVNCLVNNASGLAYGLDIDWSYTSPGDHRLRLAYSWLFTERRNSPTGVIYPSAADQPHTIKLLYSGPMGSSGLWRWGILINANNGQPYTPVLDRRLASEDGDLFFEPIFGPQNSRDYPFFMQINLGFFYASRNRRWEHRISLLGAQGLFRPNVTSYEYNELDYSNINNPDEQTDILVVPSYVVVLRFD